MYQPFDEGPITVENLSYLLRKMRGCANKMRKSFESEKKMRFAKDPEGAKRALEQILAFQEKLRVLSLYADMHWVAEEDLNDYAYVSDIPDVLLPDGVARLAKWLNHNGDADDAWNIFKIWMEGKVLGPNRPRRDGALGVYVHPDARPCKTIKESIEEYIKKS